MWHNIGLCLCTVYNEGVLFSVLIFLFVIESERGMCRHHAVLCYVWNVGALTTIATVIDVNGVKRSFFIHECQAVSSCQ